MQNNWRMGYPVDLLQGKGGFLSMKAQCVLYSCVAIAFYVLGGIVGCSQERPMRLWRNSYLVLIHEDRYVIVPEDTSAHDSIPSEDRRQAFTSMLTNRNEWLSGTREIESLREEVASMEKEACLFMILPFDDGQPIAIAKAREAIQGAGHVCAVATSAGTIPWEEQGAHNPR